MYCFGKAVLLNNFTWLTTATKGYNNQLYIASTIVLLYNKACVYVIIVLFYQDHLSVYKCEISKDFMPYNYQIFVSIWGAVNIAPAWVLYLSWDSHQEVYTFMQTRWQCFKSFTVLYTWRSANKIHCFEIYVSSICLLNK